MMLAPAATLAALAAGAASAPSPPAPDLLLVHGQILTVDAADTVAQAMAIRDGRIVAVGTDEQILALRGLRTQMLDLDGRTATPGLIDSHAHIADGGYGELYQVQLKDASSVADVIGLVKAAVARLKPGQWLQGEGWDEGKLAERRYVSAADLDAVSPDNPVWLEHTTGHYGVANSYALHLAKIAATSADPPAGTIDRGAGGAPTGVLKEAASSARNSIRRQFSRRAAPLSGTLPRGWF